MNTRIKTTDYSLTPQVESYLQERLASIERLVDASAHCDITLGRSGKHAQQGEVWFAEFDIEHNGRFHSKEEAESLTAAIDIAKDELVQQLRKSKRIHVRLMKKGGALMKRMMRWEK